ncbi:ABC transporter ATP-binding protein [Chromohalobacter sarecensis]|uniref:ABC-type dipeptide transporter n=1 Tax=Chromohalobacter sarecensis TaxID=245294 RepID=A0ABV9D0Q4_9GAMM|nr:ABC transporter ATP-binding protein [Chromohalobacter sarecensis]MCK0715228.1 ABC transporter ATP-binding protein [Chromohalobacter sarecensis]
MMTTQPGSGERRVLSVERLSIDISHEHDTQRVVDDLNFALYAGRTLCIAGESGSGKSLSSLAIMGLLPKMARLPSGAILYGERDLLELPERAMQRLRGREIAMIFQEPMTSLNPLMTVGQQLEETIRRHKLAEGGQATQRAREMLDAVRVPHVEQRLKQHPHELSGGMRQRVMIAMAMVCRPKVLIADEPTTALDVTIQAQILELMRELQREFETALLMITHDMGVVAEMADDVVVMNQGIVEESATARAVFTAPQSAYTRKLLAAVPRLGTAPSRLPVHGTDVTRLEVNGLRVRFPVKRRSPFEVRREVCAVEDVNFTLGAGETLGIVGESGCGKSTTGKALMNMLDFSGSVRLDGRELNGMRGSELKAVRCDIQMIFQDPFAALNARKSVGELVGEPLLVHGLGDADERQRRVAELLEQVGLPAEVALRYPHQFSGGQRQRICIARALALNPKVIIADEPVSALDVSVQAQVLELLESLQREYGLSYVFISHDMAVIEQICHRVAVMYCGQIVEMGSCQQVLHNPQHPYTQRLLSAVPMPDVDQKRDFATLLHVTEVPDPIKPRGHQMPTLRYAESQAGHFVAMA